MEPDKRAARSVEEWFSAHEFAHLQLPDGWFGRPWDNQHHLTWLTARPERLLLELDEQLLLVLNGAVRAETKLEPPDSAGWSVSRLDLTGFAQLAFIRRGYGDRDWSVETFDTGVVSFLRHVRSAA